MNKLIYKNFNKLNILAIIFISSPAIAIEGSNYKHFLGITLDEKFWVLIAFILFLVLVGKKATTAANSALDSRSNIIKDKINHAETALSDAKNLLKDSQKALNNHKNEAENLVQKQEKLAKKNAKLYANKIEDELKRKTISAEREIQYMQTEAVALIKDNITSITLKSVEDIAVNEFKDTKSAKIYEDFINDIPKALKS
jgi:F-type H+-transporting ATPase subunit b